MKNERYDEDGKDTCHRNYGNRGIEAPRCKERKTACKNNSKQYTRGEKLKILRDRYYKKSELHNSSMYQSKQCPLYLGVVVAEPIQKILDF